MDSRDLDDRPILSDVEQDALERWEKAEKPIEDATLTQTFYGGMRRLAVAMEQARQYRRDHAETIKSAAEELEHAAEMLKKVASDLPYDMPL